MDDALTLAATKGVKVQHCIIYDRKLDAINKVEGRDLIYQEEMEAIGNVMVPCSEQKSDDPSYILYTSGTTGKPKVFSWIWNFFALFVNSRRALSGYANKKLLALPHRVSSVTLVDTWWP